MSAALNWARRELEWDTLNQNGKSGQVPLNEAAREALSSRASLRALHCPASPWVFCAKDGVRIVNTRKAFTSCVQSAGLEDVHPHDLRRTCGNWLIQAGVPIERVSELLRHADAAITHRVYARLRPSDLADAISVLDHEGIRLSRELSRTPATGGRNKKTGRNRLI